MRPSRPKHPDPSGSGSGPLAKHFPHSERLPSRGEKYNYTNHIRPIKRAKNSCLSQRGTISSSARYRHHHHQSLVIVFVGSGVSFRLSTFLCFLLRLSQATREWWRSLAERVPVGRTRVEGRERPVFYGPPGRKVSESKRSSSMTHSCESTPMCSMRLKRACASRPAARSTTQMPLTRSVRVSPTWKVERKSFVHDSIRFIVAWIFLILMPFLVLLFYFFFALWKPTDGHNPKIAYNSIFKWPYQRSRCSSWPNRMHPLG